ncbi:tetratricopeptide repeat-containing sensor histidine kinase [Arcticibacter svalbardensis]|uniref:tetratricopeptide repeat-containing sensor histidine kinase n=1 Tax=Arcticibacter svalbardensis TaxID=1288027 RepID=UPI0012679267|nr:ATP-binding protein [Arcticibacter svalbardensis]
MKNSKAMRQLSLICFVFLNTIALSQEHPSKLLLKLKVEKSDTAKVWIYQDLGTYYLGSNLDSSLYYIKSGLTLARKVNYPYAELVMIGKLATINTYDGNLSLAKHYAEESLKGLIKINNKQGVASGYDVLGTVESKMGNYPEAIADLLKSVAIYKKLNNNVGVVQSTIKLAEICSGAGELEKSLGYYKKAQRLSDKKPSEYETIRILQGFGILYVSMGKTQQALTYFLKGVQKSNKPAFASLHVPMLIHTGNAYYKLGYKDKALTYYQQSLSESRIYKLPASESRALLNLASDYSDKKEFKQALERLQKSLSIAIFIHDKNLISESCEAMIAVFNEQGNYKDAFLISEKRYNLNKDAFSIDRKKEMEMMQSVYEKDKANAHVKTLQFVNSKRTLQRNTGIGVAIFVILILASVYITLYNVRKLNKKLKASNLVKDKLFSIIGHDLRGPVGNIVQMLTLFENGGMDQAELKGIVGVLKKHTEASLSTLDSLLDWGRIQIQGVSVKQTSFEVDSIVKKNLNIFQAPSSAKLIQIVNHIPAGIQICADPDHFDFVLRNLISNAIKFTYAGGVIELKAQVWDIYIRFSVCDNGKGMNEQDAQNLFSSFALKAEGTNGELGTGIGLMLCKEFILANDGLIWVESGQDKGAEFFFTFKR